VGAGAWNLVNIVSEGRLEMIIYHSLELK